MNSKRGFMHARPFLGQAAPAASQETMAPIACPSGPDTMDVIDANTGFVYYRNQPGRVKSHPDCQKYGYAFDPDAKSAPTTTKPVSLPATVQPPPGQVNVVKWLGPTPGSPYKPFLSAYPPVSSTYTVAQGTPFNSPPNRVNVATQPPAPDLPPPPMTPTPPPSVPGDSTVATVVAVGAGLLALGAGAYFIFFSK